VDVAFRPLERADLPLVARWLAQPHVREWWRDEPTDLAGVTAKYAPYLDGRKQTEVFVVTEAGRPVGLIQRYRVADHPDWARALAGTADLTDAVGIDYLLGEPDAVGRGLGTAAIAAFVPLATTRYAARSVVVACQQANRASWRALERAGFSRTWAGELDSADPSDAGPSYVYVARAGGGPIRPDRPPGVSGGPGKR
jgi:aminoglycoside 6'-N-acetyltransferase